MRLRIGLTCGEPAGIGAEVAVRALAEGLPAGVEPVLVGPRAVWEQAAALVGARSALEGRELWAPSEDLRPDWAWGRPTARSGRIAAEAVEHAARACLERRLDAMVTAPLTKEGLAAAGRPYPGHTELLEALCGGAKATMMLAGPRLRVVLVTTHAALADVPRLVTREAVLHAIEAAHRGLTADLGIARPRLAVTGLNPHCGEGGLLGCEERETIAPALDAARAAGISAEGPFAADGLFPRAFEGEFDAVVAMYHDQGLVALKLAHFHEGVNVTLGLPLVRTSPDHGTAFDRAGRGTARADSFREAVRQAAEIAGRRLGSGGRP
ncbi:MAG: 4-hydroxythreonine-4-phosphate dehydrogenase PdxA [Deltaproteobacteria bacterium]|nr:4-hydroxythreonine-4-phosphate dehydrogenase PdxA [Deltaproteobacteria bacterium]